MENGDEPIVVNYARITQKQGTIENLPTLASAEFGFSHDSGQLFIGSDPELSSNSEYDTISIMPFLNAREVIQGVLDASTDYTHLKVDQDLKIRTGNNLTALAVMNYVNEKFNENVTEGRKAIAFVDSNIEIVTNKNIHQFSNPPEFTISYSATERINAFQNSSYYKMLTEVDGNQFLSFPINGALKVTIDYMLIQGDGVHVRGGVMHIIADSTTANGTIATMEDQRNDLKSIPGGVINANKIEFTTETDDSNVYVKFTQPEGTQTKVFYRIQQWHINDYQNINNYTSSGYIGPLGN